MKSPFTPAMKIDLIESNSTMPVSILIGLLSGWLAYGVLGWTLWPGLVLTLAFMIIFLSTPLPRIIRAFARRKAEAYYYGT